MKLDNIKDIMLSPCCNKTLYININKLYCTNCELEIKKINNSFIFTSNYNSNQNIEYKKGLKYLIKNNQLLYKLSLFILSPVHIISPKPEKIFENHIRNNEVILNIGSGNQIIHKDIINIDFNVYENVDIIADSICLPIKDCSVNGIISFASLEHISHSSQALSEFNRISKIGSYLYIYVPFLQPMHGSPSDYRRWNINGLIEDLNSINFKVIDFGIGAGPSSTLAWITAEYFAIIFSFGIHKIYKYISLPLMVLFSPIKWIDILLNRNSKSDILASAVWVVSEKIKV